MEIAKDKLEITKYLNSISNQLELKGSLNSDDNSIRDKLQTTFLMSDYKSYHLYDSFLIKKSNAYLTFYQVSYKIKNGKYDIGNDELQTIGIKKLKTSYGHIIIRPEFIIDKIAEIFYQKEIDFTAYPIFSDNYYVLISNETGKLFFTDTTIKLIEKLQAVYIEIIENILFIKFLKKFNSADTNSILNFLKLIS